VIKDQHHNVAGDGHDDHAQKPPFHATIITVFPEMFPGPLGLSTTGRALGRVWSLDTVDVKGFVTGPFGRVDDSPFGGGAGMVLRPDVVGQALDTGGGFQGRPCYYLSPRGKRFTQADAASLAKGSGVVLLWGRYEGLDQRVLDHYGIQEISMGDYVLSGGEIAAMAMLDACVRLLPGVMGNDDSGTEESFSTPLLEYPHYTRPAEWKGMDVPKVLRSGHHAAIKAWRKEQAERITRDRRPDLWEIYTSGTRPDCFVKDD
jgi:tRNA (guanine37-N1)-methyltransferase